MYLLLIPLIKYCVNTVQDVKVIQGYVAFTKTEIDNVHEVSDPKVIK